MMCVSGEKEGGRERERGVMMCGYEKTLWYIQFPIRCIIHVHVLTTHTTPCTQITA